MAHIFYISGIDTDCGKTYITGLLARNFVQQGYKTITQKLVQTGCSDPISEDIAEHRKLMNIEAVAEDYQNITCPYIFSYPASPHFAAEIEHTEIDNDILNTSTETLSKKYSVILVEGAGGLCVPLTHSGLFIDYIAEHRHPVLLVCSSKLGSINHSILSLEICKQKNIQLHTVIYNFLPDSDPKIAQNSFEFIQSYLQQHFPETEMITSIALENGTTVSL
ncbi:MAG: dethiobiotin synthase [Bacteroidales bacterium]|jgi:dethiobiotin synthetase|nr:dethiobiotin synthase [Bacteroidales bacterium]